MQGSGTATADLREEHQLILRVVAVLEEIIGHGSLPSDLDLESASDCITFFKQFTDACHHGKEEDLLFPELEAHGMPGHGGPIAVMLEEHRIGRTLVRRMAESVDALRGGPDGDEEVTRFVGAARDYVELIRGHITKEDGVLFDMADLMIVGPACARLCEAYGSKCLGKLDGHTREELEAMADRLVERHLTT